MALIGNCTYTVYTDHETETTTETITMPTGETETVETPVIIETSTDYQDVYLVINFVTIDRRFCNECGGNGVMNMLYYRYAAYSSREAKNNDIEDFLFQDTNVLTDYDFDDNVYSEIYNQIKTLNGLTNLIDD